MFSIRLSKDLDARRKAIEEQRRIERQRDIAEQIQRFLDARPLSPERNRSIDSSRVDATDDSTPRFEEQVNSDTDSNAEHRPIPGTNDQDQLDKEKERKKNRKKNGKEGGKRGGKTERQL